MIDYDDPAWDAPLTQDQWNVVKYMFEDRSESISA